MKNFDWFVEENISCSNRAPEIEFRYEYEYKFSTASSVLLSFCFLIFLNDISYLTYMHRPMNISNLSFVKFCFLVLISSSQGFRAIDLIFERIFELLHISFDCLAVLNLCHFELSISLKLIFYLTGKR